MIIPADELVLTAASAPAPGMLVTVKREDFPSCNREIQEIQRRCYHPIVASAKYRHNVISPLYQVKNAC